MKRQCYNIFYCEVGLRSLLETMAMVKPIITTDASGRRESLVDGVNGFVVKPMEKIFLLSNGE